MRLQKHEFSCLALAVLLLASLSLSAETVNYQYDSLHRLTKVTYSNGTIINYSYDPAGNRTQRTISGSPATTAALEAFYNSTNGPAWTTSANWLTGHPCLNNWYGITCDANNNVTEIMLWSNNLTGELPEQISDLSTLTVLDLYGNSIGGILPGNLDKLTNLVELDLTGNAFIGNIPSNLGNLTQLQKFRATNCNFTGGIPSALGSIASLNWLDLAGIPLGGEIPATFANLHNLTYLRLDSAQLSGGLSAQLGGLSKLEHIYLSNNKLTGPIPAELGSLPNLEQLRLDNNELTGQIPVELATLANLRVLQLGNNKLTGNIPAELGNLSKLQLLHLYSNQLNGTLPIELGNLTNLHWMALSGNQLTGSIPSEFGNLINLMEMGLSSNQLSGSIPATLGNLNLLQYLNLSLNSLSGAIPVEFGNLVNLQHLYLYRNQLNGTIPAELGNLTNLEYLNISGNQLSGMVPVEFGDLIKLKFLGLSSNQFVGSIPSALLNLTLLGDGELRLTWNGLYTTDIALDSFLDTKSGPDWSATQTVTPVNVTVTEVNEHSATLTWDVIEYTSDSGRYRVLYSTSAGGPYIEGGVTANKSESELTVSGLPSNSTVYFVVQTETDSHINNTNSVISEPSIEVSDTTPLGSPGFYINPSFGLITTETGGEDTFQISLNTQPSADVFISLTSSDPSEGVISDTNLTFTTGDWNLPRSITVTGVDDDDPDGHKPFSIITGVASSADTDYNGIDPDDVSVINQDDEDFKKAALEALYHNTDGDNWNNRENWLIGDPCEDNWYGITCDEDKNITGIGLIGNNLFGTIPPELGVLTSLQNLQISRAAFFGPSRLNGSIPPEIGNLINLRTLSLQGNELTGDIPTELSNLINLESLSLGGNQLTGTIPAELGDLTKLRKLALDHNPITGSIPAELANLSQLQALYLSGTRLAGSIPPELGNLANLNSLSLGNTSITGSIPAELANLDNLQDLYLSSSQLTGSIPPELGRLSQLTGLSLGDNQLTGGIPIELGNLSNLSSLNLKGNPLGGSIPTELGNLTKLHSLLLSNTQLSGRLPKELGNLTNLQTLWLSQNQLNGPIPPEVGNMSGLEDLVLGGNQLSGEIPRELGNLVELQDLLLYDNQLTGNIPFELGRLTKLQRLILYGNELTGSIPVELGNLVDVYHLSLDRNKLTGDIPRELGNLTNLEWLKLGSNQLTGIVPAEFVNLVNLTNLSLRWNGLYASETAVDDFLDNKSGEDWSLTQTVPPTGIEVSSVSGRTVMLTWNEIEYSQNTGRYRALCSLESGGPFSNCGFTPDKNTTSLEITGLAPEATHYFVIQTETDRHANNQNKVVSESSNEVSATTEILPPGIYVSPQSGLTTSESGETDVFEVILDSQPTSTVTIPVSSSDPGEVSTDTENLIFTDENWNISQPVIVIGVDDEEIDGHQKVTINIGPASASDPNYTGIDPPDISVVNFDDDATVIDFEGIAPEGSSITGVNPYLEDGYKLVAQDSDFIAIIDSDSPTNTSDSDVYNWIWFTSTTLSREDDRPFSIFSIDAGGNVSGEENDFQNIRMVGTLASGETVEYLLPISWTWKTFKTEGFRNLTSVHFSTTATDPYPNIDNIVVDIERSAHIGSFLVSPKKILTGQSTNISWSVNEALVCQGKAGVDGWSDVSITLPSGNADLQVFRNGCHTFILECTDGINTVVATQNLEVTSPDAIFIDDFEDPCVVE